MTRWYNKTVNKSMKILLFSTAYLPHLGGAELAVKEIADRLAGVEFDLITAKLKRGLPDFERIGNMNVYRIGAGNPFLDKPLLPNLGFIKAVNFHKKKKYDLVHGVMASQGSAAAYLFKLFYPKVPFVLTLQEGDLGRNSPFDRFWQRRIIKKADAITAISGYLGEFAKRYNKKAPLHIVPNGVDLKMFETQSQRSEKKDIKKIITVSRLVRKNGIDVLIRAVKELKLNDCRLQIVGYGEERKKLEKLARKLGLEDRVDFFANATHDEIVPYLANADVFVRPSRSEGLGSAFLEAMAAGIPIIGTKVGGIPDFLEDGKTGLFSKADDPEDLAEKMGMVLGDETLSRKLSENGRKLVEERYNWDRIAALMKGVYEKTVNNHSGL